MECFVNFGVIVGYVWEEICFLKGFVKFKEIKNVFLKLEFKAKN